ncbi:cobalt chelatase [Gordonia sp. TBRC 11910]|uniref:Cobalt chelatase n=1 Tax=Gordonia asplenii TaxID=2725283 RepID=A0A848KWT6_9ACTN|nr:cobalt chelatase [Gordonia asplenii]NMO03106.1 cobalt chelatase [Gordonia asplenii]
MSKDAAAVRREQRIRELRASSIRALSGHRGVVFRGTDLYDSRRRIPVSVAHLNPPSERGAADAVALRLLYTDPEVHRELLPEHHVERLVFEMLEQFRVESLVPPEWAGVRRNVGDRFRQWAVEFEASPSAETASGLLLYALSQVSRSRITAEPIDEITQGVIEQTRFDMLTPFGASLADLRRNRHSQRRFGAIARQVAADIADLPLLQVESDPTSTTVSGIRWLIDLDSDDVEADPNAVATGSNRKPTSAGSDYHVFTRAYDEVRLMSALVRAELLVEYRQRIDALAQAGGVSPRLLGRQLARLFAAPHAESSEGGHQAGHLDARRLPQLVTSFNERNIFRVPQQVPRSDGAVTFLVDCSGSMKAYSESVAVLLDLFSRAFDLADIDCEILGFTTAAWNGGRTRKDWMRSGRPANPGRLNEIRHLVIKDADTPWRSAKLSIAGLLKLDLYREGVDGEAIEWACARLTSRERRRRVLVVISDGSPMDGATSLANGDQFLHRHLQDVLSRERSVAIAAIGVGVDLSLYYDHCTAVDLTDGVNRSVTRAVLSTITKAVVG